jgi:hypothetical protein
MLEIKAKLITWAVKLPPLPPPPPHRVRDMLNVQVAPAEKEHARRADDTPVVEAPVPTERSRSLP